MNSLRGLQPETAVRLSEWRLTDAEPREERKQKRRTGEEVDVFSAMDVTVYPPPPQPLAAPDHTRLGQHSYPEPGYSTNKVRTETRNLYRLLLLAIVFK